MSLQKNVAGQKWRVFAFNITTGAAVTGDAANITAKISKDGGGSVATNDVNPTEDEEGYYDFDLTQAESNADDFGLIPVSATADVQVIGVPGKQSAGLSVAARDNHEDMYDGTGYVDPTAPASRAQVDQIPALIAALNDIAVADVLTQALAALDTAIGGSPTADSVNQRLKALDEDWEDGGRLDALIDRLILEIDTATGEPGQGTAGVSLTRGQKMDQIYKAWRNRTNQTAVLWQLFADDGVTVDQKRDVSDDLTTFEAAEIESGP